MEHTAIRIIGIARRFGNMSRVGRFLFCFSILELDLVQLDNRGLYLSH